MDLVPGILVGLVIWASLILVAVMFASKRSALLAIAAGGASVSAPVALGLLPIALSNGQGELGPVFVGAFVAALAALTIPLVWIVGILFANAADRSTEAT